MSIQRTPRDCLRLAAITALAVFATAASSQTGPEPIEPHRHDPVARDEITAPSQRADSGNPTTSGAHRCQFRILGDHGHQVTGLDIFNDTPTRTDRTYGAIFPVGNPAPAHPWETTCLGVDYPDITDWKFSDISATRCHPAEDSAFGRFSLELNSACLDE